MTDESMMELVRRHYPEYLLEAFGLGLFMISACAFGVLLFHPASPVIAWLPDPLPRRGLMGLAMGLTAVVNIYSPWGRRSGSHLNPAVTLAFWRLGKVDPRDLGGYVAAQFAGGVLGTLIAAG
ncbi:MAG: aquaporin, partial [Gemmatimonadales bacterium]